MVVKMLEHRKVTQRKITKETIVSFFVLISVYVLIFNMPIFKTSTNFQKNVISDIIVNTDYKADDSFYKDMLNGFLKYIYNKYFTPKSFLTDIFPSFSEGNAIPKVEIKDVPIVEFEDIKTDNIIERQNSSQNLEIKNETQYKVDVQSILSEKPSFKNNYPNPIVLIVHTHSSEAYHSNGEFELSDTDRTQDENYNVIRVGSELKKILENKGIGVIHDKTVHDYPSYTNSYINTLKTINKNLEKYPSLQIVFDLHRDALGTEDEKVKFTCEINGETAAQVMLVCGTDSMGLEFDSWEDNLRFAMQIQDRLERCYPNLARPINLRKERFNMHVSKGSLLFEVGTNGNTLSEALVSIKYIGDTIGDVINDLCV